MGSRVKSLSADEFMDLAAVRQVMLAAGISEPARQHQVLTRYLSGEDDELITALREVLPPDEDKLYRELLQADFDALYQLNDDGRYADAAQRAYLTIARYPYLSSAYLELAIALDQQDSHELAVDQLLAAIMLTPHNPLPWRSLSVVLNRLESGSEANFANAFHAALQSGKQQLSRWLQHGRSDASCQRP